MNGCEFMKCSSMVNGICTHEGSVCKYRSESGRIEQLELENATLKSCVGRAIEENAELKRQLDDASKALQDYQSSPCYDIAYDVAYDRGAMAAKQKYAAEIAELKAKLAQVHKDLGCELQDPNGTIWEHAAKVQEENASLKADNERLVKKINQMNNEYIEVVHNISGDREVLKSKLAQAEESSDHFKRKAEEFNRQYGKVVEERNEAEAKLAEWKDVLGGYGAGPENVLHWIQGATTRCLLSEEYERQVRDGELIRVHAAEKYVQELVKSIANEFGYNHHLCVETLIDDLKGYAVRRQKEGGE